MQTPKPPDHQPDAGELDPNEQTVLSQQTAPNRTPDGHERAIDAQDDVAPGNAPDPLGEVASRRRGTGTER